MRRFFIKVTFLILLPWGIFGLFIQPFIDNKLANSNLSNYKEWNDILNSRINADLIIQGSSRAWVHISPHVIDSALSLNSYNLGIDGYDFQMQYYRFVLYLKYNKKPKYILQCVDPFTLSKREDLYMPEQFLPYLNIDIIKQAVKNYKGFDNRDFYLPLLKYTHTATTIKLITESIFKDPAANYHKYKGFQAQNREWNSDFDVCKKNSPQGYRQELNKETRALFEKYLDFCKKENIKVIFIYTPEYYEVQKLLINRDYIINIFKNYSLKFGIPFLDYSNDSIGLDTINFYNSQHMNANGVRKFNFKLSNDLQGIIK